VAHNVPLWRQLQALTQVLAQVGAGASGTASLEAVPLDLRPGVQALSFHVWRNLGRARALRALLVPRTPAPKVDALLCAALALVWSPDAAPYDAFTLVNQAVEAAKRSPDMARQAAFINACLRRFLREPAQWIAQTDADPVAVWNHPLWWIQRLQADHPQRWQGILQAANRPAPMVLRVNTRQGSRESYLVTLADAGLQAQPVGACGVALARAAPGGKTGHLLERTDAAVVAVESDARRAGRIDQTLQRLNLHATVHIADVGATASWWDGVPFDAILLDAPCTASGIVRRHPDVRWLRRETDIAQLAAVQATLLRALWPLLKPGGRLLYCTCSVFRQEGQAQVETFLAHNTDACLLPSPGHLIPQKGTGSVPLPDNPGTDHDGFFYALLQKSAA
jgi:16S rRNA (cytosine967-C5)-methyltransferase